jgi:hypothetical protein
MNPIEDQIIKSLIELKDSDYSAEYAIESRLAQLTQEQPLGTSGDEFRSHAALNAFIVKTYGDDKNYFMLWLRIEDYLSSTNIAPAQEKLNQVEEALKKCLEELTPEAKARGTAMLPKQIANAQFMRNLYSLNNENLSTLFLKYLPAPRPKVFAGQAMPEIIAQREQTATNTIKDVLGRNENNLASVESKLVKVQRKFRAKKRKKENLQRLPHRYSDVWQGPNKPRGMTTEGAKELLADANKPYQPQCEEKLAKRIMEAAKKVELFSTVSHLTAATALESIFNDGLLGRRSILQFYMPFKPASLWQSDIEDGDANVVCLGANAIDPKARHGIELQFDAKKIAENNPCVFYKQRDLGYDPEKKRSIRIGDLDLCFSHTGTYRCQPSDVSSMVLYHGPHGGSYAWSKVIKAILIADNLEEMHRILTLNFFRFVDHFMNSDFSENTYYKEQIYSALSKLSDQELVETLLKIGKNMTDSMEFNFYGAYKIDFPSLLTIKNENSSYTLKLPTFVDELKAGNLGKLNEASEKLPEIFNSYRFIDYLISTTNNKRVIAELQEQRKKCTLPSWMEESKQETPSSQTKQDYSRASQNNISITSKAAPNQSDEPDDNPLKNSSLSTNHSHRSRK